MKPTFNYANRGCHAKGEPRAWREAVGVRVFGDTDWDRPAVTTHSFSLRF